MKYWRQEQGFLMIEVLIATVIVSIALVAAAGMFIQSTRATASSADYTAATAIAQDYLERVKVGLLANPYAASYTETLNNITYTVTLQETVAASIDNRLFQEIVTVAWIDRGNPVSFQMTTYIVKNISQFP